MSHKREINGSKPNHEVLNNQESLQSETELIETYKEGEKKDNGTIDAIVNERFLKILGCQPDLLGEIISQTESNFKRYLFQSHCQPTH